MVTEICDFIVVGLYTSNTLTNIYTRLYINMIAWKDTVNDFPAVCFIVYNFFLSVIKPDWDLAH